jgi:hypothetical protein
MGAFQGIIVVVIRHQGRRPFRHGRMAQGAIR